MDAATGAECAPSVATELPDLPIESDQSQRPLRVLLVSVFRPETHRGGAQQITYELFNALKERPDVESYFLAGADPTQRALYKAGARITGFDGRKNEFLFLTEAYDYWWHKCSSPLLLESFAGFLELIKPDVVHFHHFMQLGLDLLTLTRRILPHAKIVFTFHEFMTICAADGQMVRVSDKSLCTKASPVRCHQCFPERGPEQFFLRELWIKRHLSVVDAFTVPSKFMIEFYEGWGIPREKLTHVPNGQPDYSKGLIPTDNREKRNRFGFFGQLVDNKGVWVILEAVRLLRADGFTDFSVEINGDNLKYASAARRAEIEAFMAEEEDRPFDNRIVQFNGPYHVDQIRQRMARVDWCIVPSTWWEIFGLVISEAWMFGRPVIASNVGGPAERIRDGVNGLLFDLGSARSLGETIRRVCRNTEIWDRLTSGIELPPGREVMRDKYCELYTSGTVASKD
jgi:glycosyltransferase involved in cell wall biosynthesis